MKIIFLQAHTHAGTVYPAQAEADLDEASARWCIAAGVAQATAASIVRPRSRRDAAPDETQAIPTSETPTLESAP